ncbi:hypothetical protein HPB52_016542 [Rhipicephalus sanguineus]|uniref:RING-type domain-containing protein n=1 Tax=Rhipicephalus sanguineus TaxID=34632 RepID=A0A9D4TB10_RHISA|nr:hypothetical protein HPB52_016542 [Rhipicephalus sanguineus]
MDDWTYTLTGFGDFLELRRVSFAEPMAATRVCGVCGLLPSRVQVLPCEHVVCDLCYSHIGSSERCPVDGKKLEFPTEVHTITFKLSELEQSRVFCAAASGGCGFAGKLCELKNHLTLCGGGEVRCGKCRRPIVRGLAGHHVRACPGETVEQRKAAVEYRSRSAGLKCLVKRVASLERELREMRDGRNSGDEQRDSSYPPDWKKRKSVPIIVGPFRAASAAGVLITTCKFADVYASHESLNEHKKERRISSDTYTLGGYTFRLDCEFSKGESETYYVRFILFLRDGEWDSYVEWPFSKKVTLIVMHPRDAANDIRLPLAMNECRVVKRPRSGSWNWGRWTDKINWESVELRGFVDRGILYVNVEFE